MKANDLFEKVTNDLVAAIQSGAKDWQMPWHRLGFAGLPHSVDGRPYRGWNAFVLSMVAADRRWSSTWATYRGWQRHDCQVRKGERGTQVVLWKPIENKTDDDGDGKGGRSMFARAFTVFNAEQVDGGERFTTPTPERPASERIADVDAYFERIGADVKIGGDQACYIPALDQIRLPHLDRFDRPEHYYSTAAHEHAHWTGHASRLDRDLSGRFGDHAYGAEELIAELSAAFWSAQFGLEQATRHDHAAYLGDWLALLKSDTRALVTACSKAQHAVDHLNERAGWQPSIVAATDSAA
jgi:antirestriction protein ArdC